jgi:hypothetical protein
MAKNKYATNFAMFKHCYVLAFTFCLLNFVSFSSASELGAKLHHQHIHRHRAANNATLHSNFTDSNANEAKAMIARAQAALAIANKRRIDNIQLNIYAFQNRTTIEAYAPAPPLAYNNTLDLNSTNAKIDTRIPKAFNASAVTSTSDHWSYSLPPELIEAARIVAESEPPVPSTGNHSAIAADVKARYAPNNTDTNRMPQAIRQPDGLFEHVAPRIDEMSNVTGPSVSTRATSEFWMANIRQNGASPFAPSGYKG